ncbi:MAG: hypothetical protein HYZ28_11340 [Myxococcales bacterium]|nr:hypothetical protein [Myxococcales bacterium]
MAKQNLTVRLDKEIIRKARMLAAERGSSISELVSRTIDEMVSKAESYDRARDRALRLLEQGFHMGKARRVSRSELHERR